MGELQGISNPIAVSLMEAVCRPRYYYVVAGEVSVYKHIGGHDNLDGTVKRESRNEVR
jgi:hypothetical protein